MTVDQRTLRELEQEVTEAHALWETMVEATAKARRSYLAIAALVSDVRTGQVHGQQTHQDQEGKVPDNVARALGITPVGEEPGLD